MARTAAAATAIERGRGTSRHTAVLDSLRGSDRFRTAQDIYSELRANGARIGLTTVYRHLQKLADDGVIHAVQTADRQIAYRLCSPGSHYHLVCTGCGAGIEIADPDLENWVEAQASRRGYSDLSHRIDIFGLCPQCTAEKTAC